MAPCNCTPRSTELQLMLLYCVITLISCTNSNEISSLELTFVWIYYVHYQLHTTVAAAAATRPEPNMRSLLYVHCDTVHAVELIR